MEKLKVVAERYINYGLAVLPVRKDKSPHTKLSWNNGIQPENFNGAFGIGVICGKISGGLECLDFDNHQGDAKERITKFSQEAKHILDSMPFVLVSTGGGGYHILYRCEGVDGNKKLARIPVKDNGRWKPDVVIETKGEGGYIVASPTNGYNILRGSMDNIPVISVSQRNELLDIAYSFNQWNDTRPTSFEEQDRPGDRYNESIEGIEDSKSELIKAGWVNTKGKMWRRPGKKDGISATFGVVAPNVFYVFSSNAYPFDENKAYKPFQIISLLRYGGDFGSFARELSEKETPKSIQKQNPHKDYDDIIKRAFVDLSKPIEKPPVAMSIRSVGLSDVYNRRLFTLGNFSAITGKAKSKKTFFLSMIAASLVSRDTFNEKFQPMLPNDKKKVIYFDTEQGDYDVYMLTRRIKALSLNSDFGDFHMYQLRQFTPMERCDIIERVLELNPDVGFVFIDGIADLGTAINDEDEATRVVSLLLRWSKQYNCHICNVIHQNKMNEFATGHLGSSILKKAEIIISVSKDNQDVSRSIVKCDMSRGADFEDFIIKINDKGLPELDDAPLDENIEFESAPF